eukprot:255027-Chlamydomonas_euryale.AAC.3
MDDYVLEGVIGQGQFGVSLAWHQFRASSGWHVAVRPSPSSSLPLCLTPRGWRAAPAPEGGVLMCRTRHYRCIETLLHAWCDIHACTDAPLPESEMATADARPEAAMSFPRPRNAAVAASRGGADSAECGRPRETARVPVCVRARASEMALGLDSRPQGKNNKCRRAAEDAATAAAAAPTLDARRQHIAAAHAGRAQGSPQDRWPGLLHQAHSNGQQGEWAPGEHPTSWHTHLAYH